MMVMKLSRRCVVIIITSSNVVGRNSLNPIDIRVEEQAEFEVQRLPRIKSGSKAVE